MKKIRWLAILLAVSILFAGCSFTKSSSTQSTGTVVHSSTQKTPVNPTEVPTETPTEAPTEAPVVEFPNAKLATGCMLAITDATDAEEAANYLTEDSCDNAQNLVDFFSAESYTISTTFCDTTDGYDIFTFNIVDDATNQTVNDGWALFQRNGDHYLLCNNAQELERILSQYLCNLCSGTGQIWIGNNTACATCGGTGQWYNPAAYYDSFMNMWMGQYQACGGCGGAGWLPGQTSTICTACGGDGHHLK